MKILTAAFWTVFLAIASSAHAYTVQEEWLFGVVYMANETTGAGGTGFIVSREVEKGKGQLFLVSNKHVLVPKAADPAVSNKTAFAVMHITKEGNDGELLIEPIRVMLRDEKGRDLWTGHPVQDVDVAVLRVTDYVVEASKIKPQYKVGYIKESDFATDQHVKDTHLNIGDQVVVLGYPINIVEGRSSIPVARGGVIGTPPDRKFRGKDFFLIDCATIRGSSGSPVFIPIRPYTVSYDETKKLTTINSMKSYFPKLLGIVFATVSDWELIIRRTDAFGKPPKETSVMDTANFGIVFPAKVISETLDSTGVKRHEPRE